MELTDEFSLKKCCCINQSQLKLEKEILVLLGFENLEGDTTS
jgi:hypothetical protein